MRAAPYTVCDRDCRAVACDATLSATATAVAITIIAVFNGSGCCSRCRSAGYAHA